jgi:regulator of Ty1 transposition protein 103
MVGKLRSQTAFLVLTDSSEVAQQSKIRHKEDFIIAFSPVLAEAAAIAYKGAPTEIQGKLRRVFEVWRDRTIFEAPIQRAIESRLDGKSISTFCQDT